MLSTGSLTLDIALALLLALQSLNLVLLTRHRPRERGLRQRELLKLLQITRAAAEHPVSSDDGRAELTFERRAAAWERERAAKLRAQRLDGGSHGEPA